jgi:hypothetical protein
MKTARTLWAVIALLFALNTPISAQKSWTPLQKEWLAKIMQLWAATQKPYPKNSTTTTACAVSNEITLTIAPCNSLQKETAVVPKPVQ